MKLRHRFENMSIFTKISIATVALIIASSVISSAFILVNFSQGMKSKNRLLVNEAVKRIETFTKDKYNMMYNQRTLLHSTDYIAGIIASTREYPSDIYQPQNLKKITEYLNALCYSDNDIQDAILFTADGKNAFSHSNGANRRIYLNYEYNTLPYIEDFLDSKSTITAVYDSDPPYLTLSSKGDKDTITFIGKILDMNYPTHQIVIGYLLINFSPSTIDETYNEIDTASDGEYMVVNSNSQIIYSNNPSYLDTTYQEGMIPEKEILAGSTISLSGLQVIGAISDDALMKNIRTMIWQNILVAAACIACIALIIMVLHKYYKKRFIRLGAAMSKISQGDFTTKLPVTSDDELGYLSRTFNIMSETLDTYIKKNYLAETHRRTAELYALQAQINPHFLANTIESIRMCAMENDDYEASEMLKDLGNLFHWMIQFNQDIVYIEDELEYIHTYLELQRFRFQDKLSVNMDVPSGIYYYGIPRFTLQPIVENALSHGTPDLHALEIEITFRLEEENLIITVKDNGPGIPEEELERLNAHICQSTTYPEFGVALRNIHSRVRLLFGDSCGLRVDSTYRQGTTVSVTLPGKLKKELEQYVQIADCR